MDTKSNDATYNRPEGYRVIDAPFVFADINDYIRQLKEENAWQKNDRNGITLFKTEHYSMVLVCLHEKAVFENNEVNGIFTLQVVEGKIRVITAEGDIDMQTGSIVNFHPNIDHTIEATDDAVILLSNSTWK